MPSEVVSGGPGYTNHQRYAFADCVLNHKSESKWFGIWDIDEFLVFNGDYMDLVSFVSHLRSLFVLLL